jgi:hypothetical protein
MIKSSSSLVALQSGARLSDSANKRFNLSRALAFASAEGSRLRAAWLIDAFSML